MLTQAQARALIPADAKLSSSFGNPGEGGYVEYFTRPSGQRWALSNGPWHLCRWELQWQAKPVSSAPESPSPVPGM